MKSVIIFSVAVLLCGAMVGCDEQQEQQASSCKVTQSHQKAACTANQTQLQQAMKELE